MRGARAPAVVAALAIAAALGSRAGAAPPLLALGGETMGTGWSVLVRPAPGLGPRKTLARELEAILARIDARLSTWRDDSELARFNASASTAWVPVSHETARVTRAALVASRATGGAFDPTVGPLVELWGFGRTAVAGAPDPETLARTRARVGHEALDVRLDPPALRKAHPELALDFSAIAKGHAVDALADHLAAAGAHHFLVEIGGELRARGRHPSGRPWQVAVEAPDAATPPRARSALATPEAWAVVALRDAALATSGDSRRFWLEGGERRPHILDPRDGEPVHHGLASASVIADSATLADARATALMVLGPREGLRLAREQGWAVLLLERRDAGLVEHVTPGFAAHRLDRPQAPAPPAAGASPSE